MNVNFVYDICFPDPRKKKSAIKVIIIGGGIIGLACARTLQTQGHDAIVVEPHTHPHGASWGNAGHIAIEQAEPLASMAIVRAAPGRLFQRGGALALPLSQIGRWLPFAVRMLGAARPRRFAHGKAALKLLLAAALPAWHRLATAAGLDDIVKDDGHFVVWETPATAAAGRAAWASADTGIARVRDATPAELAALAALMRCPPAGAIRFEGTGRIADLGRLGESLRRALIDAGGFFFNATASGLPVADRRATVLLDDGRTLDADAIVVAAGVASAALLAPLGHVAPIIAERGYHIQASDSAWPVAMPPVVFEDRSMIVTRFESGLRAASFVEFGAAASPPDPRKWARLRAHVADLGLSFAAPASEWMGARPTLPDYLPAIGRSAKADNLYYAFGHQHLGLTLAAITGELVAALVGGGDPPVDLTPFSLDRFQRTQS